MAEKTLFRTAAVTTEQVVHAKRCRVHSVRPEVASTAGTITLRNASVAEVVGTPGSVAGTAGAAGTLDDDEYFAKVVAVDANGELSAGSTEQADTTVAGAGAGSVAYTWVAGTGATPVSYRVYIGLATGVFDGYYEVTGLAFTLTSILATPGYTYVAITPADTAAATSGNAYKKRVCPIATLQAGVSLDGAVFDRGLVVTLSNNADLTSVIYEPF